MNKEILKVEGIKADYIQNVSDLARTLAFVNGIFEYPADIKDVELVDEFNQPLIVIDQDVKRMLAGGLCGYFNELVFPLDENLQRTKDEEMKEIVLAIFKEAKTQKPEL